MWVKICTDKKRSENAKISTKKLQNTFGGYAQDHSRSNACVCVENLNMRAMSNNGFGNGKATLGNGYGMFLNMLDYKLREKGGCLVKVGKFFPSSRLCNCCGFRNPALKDLSIRYWDCPNCGTQHIDRDVNAAKNIKQEGLKLLLA